MKKNGFTLNLLLCGVTLLGALGMLLTKTFLPAAILPVVNIPLLALLCLLALLLEGYLAPAVRRTWPEWLLATLLATATLSLLPWAVGLVPTAQLPRTALVGAGTFLVFGLLFSSIRERLASGPVHRFAPFLSAGMLYLASQCFAGILL